MVLITGGIHGFVFASILIRVFHLNVNNRFFPEGDISSLSKLMGNSSVLTFIVLANAAWMDVLSHPLTVYAGAGLISAVTTSAAGLLGRFAGRHPTKR